jgi:hypothetical protein
MVATIGRAVRAQIMSKRCVWTFMVSCCVGGTTIGLAAGGVGAALDGIALPASNVTIGLLGVLVSTIAIADSTVGRMPRAPALKRQVRRASWTGPGSMRAPLVWGAELGFAVTTRGMSWLTWALLVWLVAVGSILIGSLAGLVFGLSRGLQLAASLLFVATDAPARDALRVFPTWRPNHGAIHSSPRQEQPR